MSMIREICETFACRGRNYVYKSALLPRKFLADIGELRIADRDEREAWSRVSVLGDLEKLAPNTIYPIVKQITSISSFFFLSVFSAHSNTVLCFSFGTAGLATSPAGVLPRSCLLFFLCFCTAADRRTA